jgi:hypothetical protein
VADRDIIIHTGRPGLQLIEAITRADESGIEGTCLFAQVPAWLLTESLAQLGALHVRYLTGFEKHAFPVAIKDCLLPRQEVLEGRYRLTGKLLSRSSAAFSYDLAAGTGKELEITGRFLYAAMDYDDTFRKELLQERYQGLFSCLTNATKKGSAPAKKRGSSATPCK